jgi:hypothetical protein
MKLGCYDAPKALASKKNNVHHKQILKIKTDYKDAGDRRYSNKKSTTNNVK